MCLCLCGLLKYGIQYEIRENDITSAGRLESYHMVLLINGFNGKMVRQIELLIVAFF